MSNLILYSITEEELKKLIRDSVTEALQLHLVNNTTPDNKQVKDDLIKLSDVAKMLNVSKVTIHAWKRNGLIPFYRISNKIYFKKDEVVSALIKAKNSK